MSKLDDMIDGMSHKMKFFLLMVAFFSMVATAYGTLAKQTDMEIVVARLDKKDLKERIEYLQEQIYYCKDNFGKDFADGDEREKKNCRKWVDELEEKYKEFDKYFKG